ncbi:hypothetical protein Q75_06700 [Bacillus coahuilensis p1.1.43]|uniref:N-acetyltransferase domain-containing protein n=1 Tax=Bacillus coahuilensis p1.1.43 TaxID=1150625 RepID=A0A147K990_9BACI|nr:GNAT family N-acetyltransferase [Bacillus coahuilensis]KUP06898.1 hypothetical protein Q75_06700 [Bacillus coahuilensis p1.1.43]
MNIRFEKVVSPTEQMIIKLNKWDNDPSLVHLTRPHPTKEAYNEQMEITADGLLKRLEHQHMYFIFIDDLLIGEMNYMIDPSHLARKVAGTAWIGITIGESIGRGKGIGYQALTYLENEIKNEGYKRIELGVFEFNHLAYLLYKKLNYKEFTRIPEFTYWNEKMWADIRMEKEL